MALFWRIILLLAIFANLLFFAWSQGYFGRIEDGREPQRMAYQVEPDKLRIGEVPPPPSPTEEICQRLGGNEGWPMADARRLHDRLKAETASGVQTTLQAIERPPGHWVFIPPLANKALLDKKLLELKQISVHDATPLLAEGADHFAISLGLFATAEAASAYLDTLKQRGVRSAIIQPRPSPAEKARLEVRASRAFWQNKLPDLLAETDLSAAHPENCPSAP